MNGCFVRQHIERPVSNERLLKLSPCTRAVTRIPSGEASFGRHGKQAAAFKSRFRPPLGSSGAKSFLKHFSLDLRIIIR
jgi:hypothetical protein